MKKWKLFLPMGILALALAGSGGLYASVKAQEPEDNTIPDRVFFDEISVGGLTTEEAADKVDAYLEQIGSTPVTLKAGENSLETTAGELGLSWSNPEILEEAEGLGKSGNLIVRYKVMKDLEHEDKVYKIAIAADKEKIAAVLEQGMEQLETEAKDGGLKRENGEFVYIPGSQGVTVNVEQSAARILEYMTTEWNRDEGTATQVELVAEVVPYRGTAEEMGRVKDLLGSFDTSLSSSDYARDKNVARGVELITGTLLYPGDEFSVNDHVNPCTKENGYELAGSYENGRTVNSYGGGLCQVSTTLYNAVIKAELEVTMRFPHSMLVGYVNPSQDAAIAGDYKDLRFKNNTDSPIYIEGYVSGKVVNFNIYGHETRDANREVSFESETISTTDPGTEFKAVDAPIGTINRVQGAHVGKKARLWKIVKVNGEVVSREEFNTSSYSPSPAIYEVGVSSGNPEAVENMNAAVATQDEGTIRAAADIWNDEALAAAAATQPDVQPPQIGDGSTVPPGGDTTTPPGGGSTTPPGGGTATPPGSGNTTPSGGGTATPPGGGTTPPAGGNQPDSGNN